MALQLINKTPEVKLMQQMLDMRSQSAGWNAIHFHLSQLLDEYKSEYQIKIAVNLIHDLLKNYDGTIYLLGNFDIVVLCHRLDSGLLDKLIFQLRYLYMDDPLAYTDVGQENPNFCLIYDLKHEWQAFYEVCSQAMSNAKRKQAAQLERAEARIPVIEREPVVNAPVPEIQETKELSAARLAGFEHSLRTVNMKSVVRRQPVCAVLPDTKMRRVFDELYINIAQLRRLLKSEVDFLSNRWLFKYITHILDERMLSLIQDDSRQFLDHPVSINLNVETLLSSAFTEFDASIRADNKVSVVFEIPVVDVFADMNAFHLARTEVQKLGYRVCLDGLTTASFSSISREKLGLDLVKVQWNADLQGDLTSRENLALKEAVQLTGSNRVILCRCDNKSAVEFGQALGISLFQGRYIDGLLNPTSKVEN